ncbi:MAG TPA: citrate/2-methylcitrate synthase [Candidatus Omnitrophota bacterium]|jgi:citrate synthase|nr:MAG: Citrate synthase [Candidatus Omnitrophica bacterium ADurb.Bin314]HOE69075.1 citrate/2-methylcitrate synthase [Candidatus Omnitrophota bacterium]HPW64734.1 citrate/2-methylcitrate synthase [Candidatus Omnitrophota bacterium]HQB94122.1 citrate/2-methylcitrate synthase [Candidatus Omnitrophota bacterium]
MPNSKKKEPSSASKLIKGLEGVVAAQTSLSDVDGENGRLLFRGIPIGELVEKSHFEEVAYLLWYGKLPTGPELETFKDTLKAQRTLSKEAMAILKLLPTTTHPMSALRTMCSLMGSLDPRAHIVNPEESQRKAYHLTGVFPTIIAAFFRLRSGKEPVVPDMNLSHAANFLYMLNGEKPTPEMEKALDAYLILLADHGLNASTFAARVTTGTLSNLYSAVTSAVGTLSGELHGAANQYAMEMVLEIGSADRAEAYVNKLLDEKKKVMGFGHRIYKTRDPRAEAFREIAKDLCVKAGKTSWLEIAGVVEKVMMDRKKIPCNVDFFSAPVLYVLGFPPDFFTTVFAASRVAGWSAHIIEQQLDNRLIRPLAEYVGPQDAYYIPAEDRK